MAALILPKPPMLGLTTTCLRPLERGVLGDDSVTGAEERGGGGGEEEAWPERTGELLEEMAMPSSDSEAASAAPGATPWLNLHLSPNLHLPCFSRKILHSCTPSRVGSVGAT